MTFERKSVRASLGAPTLSAARFGVLRGAGNAT